VTTTSPSAVSEAAFADVSAGDAAKTTAVPEAPKIAATAAEIFGFGFIALLPEGQIVVNFPRETLEPVLPRLTFIPAIANLLE
jgi:hypothetical protein